MSETDVDTIPNEKSEPKRRFEFARKSFDIAGIVAFWGWNLLGAMLVIFLVIPFLFLSLLMFAFQALCLFHIRLHLRVDGVTVHGHVGRRS